MTPLEYTLAAYASLYLRNAPRSETHALDALRPLELKIAELTGDTDWYPDRPPERTDVIFFWDADDGVGLTARCIVDVPKAEVFWYEPTWRR